MEARPIRVLLIDDDEDYFVLTRDALKEIEHQQYELEWQARYADGLAALGHGEHDVCLLDYHLGDRTGVDVLQAAQAAGYRTPIIMLTGQPDHHVDLEAMRLGAADFLTKGRLEAPMLERAIRYTLERTRGLQMLREREQRIAQLLEAEQARSRELERAYIDLRRAEAMRDDLMHMIVHDLRSPLTILLFNLGLISKALEEPERIDAVPRYLQGALASGKTVMDMIDDLLNLGKLEAGALRLELGALHLPALLAAREPDYQLQAERDGKTLTLHPPAAPVPPVQADSGLIGRVVDNLVANALKYTGRDGRVDLRVECDDHAVIVRVIDNGPGIPPEYHANIFDKYVQITDSTGVPLQKGIGLGLTFCRLAVEAHAGRIWVDSTPGQGSTFAFSLPLDQ